MASSSTDPDSDPDYPGEVLANFILSDEESYTFEQGLTFDISKSRDVLQNQNYVEFLLSVFTEAMDSSLAQRIYEGLNSNNLQCHLVVDGFNVIARTTFTSSRYMNKISVTVYFVCQRRSGVPNRDSNLFAKFSFKNNPEKLDRDLTIIKAELITRKYNSDVYGMRSSSCRCQIS